MNIFLAFFLIQWGLNVIALKYNIGLALTGLSNKTGTKFFHNLGSCDFCISHHLGVIIIPFFVLIFGIDWLFLAYPFMGASLINIVKTIKLK